MKKTLAELIDELTIVNCKIFYLIMKVEQDTHTRADAVKIQALNKQRSRLKNAINAYADDIQEVKV